MSDKGLLEIDETESAEESSSSRRTMDLELRTMGGMLRLLGDLEDDDTRERVVAWLTSRFRAQQRG